MITQLTRLKIYSWLLFFGCVFTVPAFSEHFKSSNEITQVNTFNEYSQLHSSSAMDLHGNYCVVWQSESQDGSGDGIYAQRYFPDGTPNEGEFQVNTQSNLNQSDPSIAMTDDGTFIIVWQSHNSDANGYSIYAKRYNKSGVPIGTEIQVNLDVKGNYTNPSVAINPKGNFVIAWLASSYKHSKSDCIVQFYYSGGSPNGDAIVVNQHIGKYVLRAPVVAIDSVGNCVVVWQSFEQDGSGWGIFARRLNTEASLASLEFNVNHYTEWDQWYPAIAMNEKGQSVIAWSSEDQDGSYNGIFAKHFDENGSAIGEEFQVNSYSVMEQLAPAVAMANNGDFVIAWQSIGPEDLWWRTYCQYYYSDGSSVGSEFRAETFENINQNQPSVAMNNKCHFVLTWQGYSQISKAWDIYSQHYDLFVLLKITSEGQGTVFCDNVPVSFLTVKKGENVVLIAQPDFDWTFEQWGDELSSLDPKLEIIMDSDIDITVLFKSLHTNILYWMNYDNVKL